MDLDSINSLNIMSELKDLPLDEYISVKNLHCNGINHGTKSDGSVEIQKDIVSIIDKGARINSEQAELAAKERGIKFPDGSFERVKTIFGSDSRVDRHGDIVMQDWNFKEFITNPVLLFGHDWISPPIGASLRETVVSRKDDDLKLRALKMDLFWPTEDVTKFGDEIFRLVDSGFLRTFSVGFLPGKVTRVDDEKERERLGLGKFGFVLSQNKLMEISATPIPANVGAHVLNSAAKDGKIQGDELQTLREIYRLNYIKSNDESGFVRNDSQLLELWQRMFPNVTISATRSFGDVFDPNDIKVDKRVVPVGKSGDETPPPEGDEGVSSGEEVIDNETENKQDSKHAELIRDAVEPLHSEIRSLKDMIETLQNSLDELTLSSTKSRFTGDESDNNFGSALASVLSDEENN